VRGCDDRFSPSFSLCGDPFPQSARNFFGDALNDHLRVLQNLVVPESEDAIPARAQEATAVSIVIQPVGMAEHSREESI
jgi:hypothetical protein